MGVGIEAEEGLQGLDGALVLVVPVSSGLAFGVASHVVGVNGEQVPCIVFAGPSEPSEGALQLLGLGDGVRVKQLVDGLVRGDKGQSIGQLETLLAQAAPFAHTRRTQGGFVYELERQAWFHRLTRLAAPAFEQVPCTQAQELGYE